MRLRALLFAMIALGGSGAAAWQLAGAATAYVERSTGEQVGAALAAAGQDWARVETDGLIVRLAGAAPDETSRFRAVEIVRQIVDPRRLEDRTALAQADPLAPPPFALELLRNEREVSLIGLVPQDDAWEEIRASLAADGIDADVTDMLETAKHPAPDRWQPSLDFALQVLADLPRAKISVEPGRVGVVAVTDSLEARDRLEARLRATAPEGVALALDISAPRPVIAPFAVDFVLEDGVGRFEACSAETEAALAAILAAARETRLRGGADCAVGLGAPSPDWAEAVAAGLAALRELDGGRFAVTDTAAVLTGPEAVDPETLNAAGRRLDGALPDGFVLTTVAPPRIEALDGDDSGYAPRFAAALEADGSVTLQGAMQDAASRSAVQSFAAAVFGHDRVEGDTVIDPELPEGWPRRVLAGIEALASTRQGRLEVTADGLRLRGSGLSEDLDGEVESLLAARSVPAEVEIRFDAGAAEALARAARPKPEICADDVGAILEAGSISFRAGSADIDPASSGVIAALADVLRGCPGAAFEVAGHTDAQGDAETNKALSEARAQAVMAALDAEDLPLITLAARGYGSDRPVADNDTAAGRRLNRRIEMTLLEPGAVPAPIEYAGPSAADCAAEVAGMVEDGSIQFAMGSSDMDDESAALIPRLAAALADCPASAFEIGGHTDSQGAADVNRRLSEARAEAVRAALEEAGVAAVVLTAHGYGADRPIADNDTVEGRAENRRIEISLVAELPGVWARPDEGRLGPQ